jgi:hypothetical protein
MGYTITMVQNDGDTAPLYTDFTGVVNIVMEWLNQTDGSIVELRIQEGMHNEIH